MRDGEGSREDEFSGVAGRISPARPTRSHQHQDDCCDCPEAACNVHDDDHLHLGFHWLPFEIPRGHGRLNPARTYYAPLLARPVACLGWAPGIGLIEGSHSAAVSLVSRLDAAQHCLLALFRTFSGLAGRLGGANARCQYLRSDCPNLCWFVQQKTASVGG